MGAFSIMLSLISIAFFIFICCVLACWDTEVCNWQFMFGHKVGTQLYNFHIQVNNYFKYFWK